MAGVGSQRQVDNALLDSQAMGGLAAHELAGAGDLKGGLLNLFGNLHHRGGVGERLKAAAITPGPETPTLMTASASPPPWTAPAINGESSTMLAKQTNLEAPTESWSAVSLAASMMVCAAISTASMLMPAQAGDVDAGADAARGGERLGDGLDDAAVGVADALLDECGEAAQVIDTERLCRAVEGVRDRG